MFFTLTNKTEPSLINKTEHNPLLPHLYTQYNRCPLTAAPYKISKDLQTSILDYFPKNTV